MIRTSAFIALLLGLAMAPAGAQELSTTHGFMLGAKLLATSLDPEDGERDTGGGLAIEAAYGFRNGLQIFLTAAGSTMNPENDAEDYVLAEGDLGLRYSFLGRQNRWRPFLEAGVGGISVEWDNVDFGEFGTVDVEISGPALMLGGGLDYFVSPSVALGASLRWAGGAFDEVKIDNVTVELEGDDKFDIRTARLQLGVKYFFSGR